VGALASKSLQVLFDEYSRLAELYRWSGNVYLLAVKLRDLLELLALLPVDPAHYEEKVREMMKRGADEKSIINFIDGLRNRVERFLETPELEELLAAVRGRYFRSIDELEESIERIRKEVGKPRVTASCLAEKREGKVAVWVENPGPLPVNAELKLRGAVPLRPSRRLRVEPQASATWELPVLVEGQKVIVEVAYRILGAGVKGVVTHEVQVIEVVKTFTYLNAPIPSLAELEELALPIRSTLAYTIGGWALVAHLGEGGFFHTFLAERGGMRAALKVPKESCVVTKGLLGVARVVFRNAPPDAWKLVEEEAVMMKRVKEVRDREGLKHLVDFYENGVARLRTAEGDVEVPYIAMQYCAKGSVARVAGRLSPRDALLVTLQVGATLLRCYEQGIFLKHGDLKPENVLIDEEGRAVVTDFQTALRERETRMRAVAYTPGYYHEAPDDRADVYALGRLLLDLTSGLEAPEDSAPAQLRDLIAAARSRHPPRMSAPAQQEPNLLVYLA